MAEYTSTGSLGARFVHGTAAGIDDPLVWYGGGENRRLHADHQGSIVAVTSGAGAITWINGYDEWGIPNDPVNIGRFQYTGQLWIGELGMYHYKARIYSPTLGRFLQTDPVGYDDQILYAYVGNDPINVVDPRGTDALWVTHPDGTSTVLIPVHFIGSGATPATVEAMIARVHSLNISDPNLDIQVVSTSTPVNGVLNQMDLSPGYDFTNYPLAGEGTMAGPGAAGTGGNRAHINTEARNAIGAGAHDIPHFAGIRDRYIEGERDAQGNRTSTPSPGYMDSNIMTSRSGTQLTGDQVREARTNPSTKVCRSVTGSLVPRC